MSAQVIHPDMRPGVDFDESGAGICQLVNVQRVDDPFKLGGVDAQAFLPGPQRRLMRFARRGFMQHAQERSARLRLRSDLIENAVEVSLNSTAHQLVNVTALAVQETG